MRILIIKQLFTPEPTARALDFAKQLHKEGHEVEVLTGFPCYPQGKIYEGFKQKLYSVSNIDGIKIIRVPIYPYHGNSGVRRILNYISYAFSATFIGLFLVRKADIAFAYHGAITVGIPAIINKWIRKVPFVYDINDIWPDTLSATGMIKNKHLLKIVNSWCNFTYRQAGMITVLSNGFQEKLIQRRVKKEKIKVVHHWSRDPIGKDILPPGKYRDKYFPKDKINFLFAGNIGVAQSLKSFLDVASNIDNDKFNLIILGDGSALYDLKHYAKMNKLNNVVFHPRVDSLEISKYLNSSDILVVHLKDTPLFEITIPSKTLAYLKAGKPILMGVKGDAAHLIETAKAGLKCQPDDLKDIRKKIQEFINMSDQKRLELGKNGKKYYDENLTIEGNTRKYLKIFERLRIKK